MKDTNGPQVDVAGTNNSIPGLLGNGTPIICCQSAPVRYMAEALVNVRNGVAVRCPVAAARFELPPPSSSSAFPLEPKLDRAIRLLSKMAVSLNDDVL